MNNWSNLAFFEFKIYLYFMVFIGNMNIILNFEQLSEVKIWIKSNEKKMSSEKYKNSIWTRLHDTDDKKNLLKTHVDDSQRNQVSVKPHSQCKSMNNVAHENISIESICIAYSIGISTLNSEHCVFPMRYKWNKMQQ